MKKKLTVVLLITFFLSIPCLSFENPIDSVQNGNLTNITVPSFKISGKNLKKIWARKSGLQAFVTISGTTATVTVKKPDGTVITQNFQSSSSHALPGFYQQAGTIYECLGWRQGQKLRIRNKTTYYVFPEVSYYEGDGNTYLVFRVKERDDVFAPNLKSINPIPPAGSSSIFSPM